MALCFRLQRGSRMNSKKESYLEVKDKTIQRMIAAAKKPTAKLKRQTQVTCCCYLRALRIWPSLAFVIKDVLAGLIDWPNLPFQPLWRGKGYPLPGLFTLNTTWLNLPGTKGLVGIFFGIITYNLQSNMPGIGMNNEMQYLYLIELSVGSLSFLERAKEINYIEPSA